MKKISLYLSVVIVMLAVVTVGVGSGAASVSAQVTSGALTGYGWSDTIGWISFNCLTGSPTGGNICATSPYSVTEDSSGNLSGYAWSDNVGWIQFGGLGHLPPAGGSATNAAINSSGVTSGWAQVVAGAGRTDGWDGWISLSDAVPAAPGGGSEEANVFHSLAKNVGGGSGGGNGTYGISASPATGISTGYASGSNIIGWMTFGNFPSGSALTASIVLSANPGTFVKSPTATAMLTWTRTNIDSSKTCTILGSASATTGVGATTYTLGAGSFTNAGTYTYRVSCPAVSGATPSSPVSNTVTIIVTNTPPPGSSACPAVANATMCAGEGTGSPLPTSSTIVGSDGNSAMCSTDPLAQPTLCEFYCNAGFKKVGGKCVLDGTIEEH